MAEVKRFDNYIGGQWVAGADYSSNVNPSDLSDVIGDYAKADLAQVNAAIDTARAAFPAWSTSGIQARSDALDKVVAHLPLLGCWNDTSLPDEHDTAIAGAALDVLDRLTLHAKVRTP